MIGVFGGTFDPVHYGHLRPVLETARALALREVRMIPCRQPPHRGKPQASAAQRRDMLALALQGLPGFVLDERELRRDGPSYMVDTLGSLRQEFGAAQPLALILGRDAFQGLTGWYRWQQLIELAHIVVMDRPGARPPLDARLAALLQARQVDDGARLQAAAAGNIFVHTVTQLAISATAIRQQLAAGESPRFLLPDAVLDRIMQDTLYGPAAGPDNGDTQVTGK